jgi:hypothetical protein
LRGAAGRRLDEGREGGWGDGPPRARFWFGRRRGIGRDGDAWGGPGGGGETGATAAALAWTPAVERSPLETQAPCAGRRGPPPTRPSPPAHPHSAPRDAAPARAPAAMADMEPLYCAEQIKVPDGLPELMKEYTKAVVREAPADLNAWSAA